MISLPDLTIRRFEAGDAEYVWDLHNRALEPTGAHVGNGEWDRDVTDPIAYYLDRGGEFLVGRLGPEIVVMGAYLPHSDEEVEIKRMRVEPSLQRRGLGRSILRELEQRARAAGFRRAFLVTTVQQKPARALYESAGYRVTAHGREAGFDTLRFAKALAARWIGNATNE